MPSFIFETVLMPDSYLDDEDPDTESAFDDCRSDLDGARISAREDMEEHLTEEQMAMVRITSVVFLEFDSTNISHAGGYFEVHCEAPQEVMDALTGEDKLLQPAEED